jgi:PAS domain S-box-containing protein
MKPGWNWVPKEGRLGRFIIILAAAWTMIILALLGYEIQHERARTIDMSLHRARATASRDLFWHSMIGEHGVFAGPSESTNIDTSEHLSSVLEHGHECVRLITADSGWAVSRAYHVGLFNDTGDLRTDTLPPLLIASSLGRWEDSVLTLAAGGQSEFFKVVDADDHKALRYLYAPRASLSPAAASGGANPEMVRKAISLTLPMNALNAEMWEHIEVHGGAYTVLWLFGLIILQGAHLQMKRRLHLRALMEAALRDNEDRFERVATTEHVGIWEIDDAARTTFVNRRMANMLGYSIEEILGQSMFNFMDQGARLQAEKHFERRRQFIEEQHEFRFSRRDGTYLDALLSTKPILGKEGEFRGALGIITDIGDRKRMEEELRRSKERLRQLLESTGAIVAMFGLDGRILYYGSPPTRHGESPEVMVGRLLTDILPPEIADRQLQNIRTVAGTGMPLAIGERIPLDGKDLWFDTQMYPVRNEMGVVTAVSTFSRDITQQKRTEAMLQQTEESLKLERLRSRIASDLHDDIGSTLSSTSIFGEILSKEISEYSPRATEILSRIIQSIADVQQGLHDIVWTINPDNDSLTNLLLHLQEHAAELLEARGITLHSLMPEGEPAFNLPMQVRRDVYLIFKEVINNILKHANATEVTITAEVADRFLKLAVVDNGQGFDTSRLWKGNGLQNMKRRVEAVGGTLEIKGRPKGGMAVSFRVPIA